jgi:hypothetical protein
MENNPTQTTQPAENQPNGPRTEQLANAFHKMETATFTTILEQRLKENGISIAYSSSDRYLRQTMSVANNKSILYLHPGKPMPIALMTLSLAELLNWTYAVPEDRPAVLPHLDSEELLFLSLGITPEFNTKIER